MKYDVSITAIGDYVLQFMRLRESMIIFDRDVPYNYANMVVSHTKSNVTEDPVVGDHVTIADRDYTIKEIGEDAIKNLREHGHVTFLFGDDRKVQQPGEIVLGGDKAPRVMVGDQIQIY